MQLIPASTTQTNARRTRTSTKSVVSRFVSIFVYTHAVHSARHSWPLQRLAHLLVFFHGECVAQSRPALLQNPHKHKRTHKPKSKQLLQQELVWSPPSREGNKLMAPPPPLLLLRKNQKNRIVSILIHFSCLAAASAAPFHLLPTPASYTLPCHLKFHYPLK